MAFSAGETLLHSMWLVPQTLSPTQRDRVYYCSKSQRRGTVKGSLDPDATGSVRCFGLLLPSRFKTGTEGDLLLSGSAVAADAVAYSSPGFRGSVPWSSLSMSIHALSYFWE